MVHQKLYESSDEGYDGDSDDGDDRDDGATRDAGATSDDSEDGGRLMLHQEVEEL